MKKIVYTLVVASLFVACTETLDVDFSTITKKSIVVDGGITNDTTAHVIKLAYTFDYTDTAIRPISNANVSITDGVNEFPLTEVEEGIYKTDSLVYGVPGNFYTLTIELADGQVYSASDYMNPQLGIDSISLDSIWDIFTGKYYKTLKFFGQEPPESGNFYRWDFYINNKLATDTVAEAAFQSDEWVNGNYVYDFEIFYLRNHELPIDGTKYTMEMRSISAEYYDFLVSLMLETRWRGGPFDATPANVPTNIEGGYGFFYAASVSRKHVIYTSPDN